MAPKSAQPKKADRQHKAACCYVTPPRDHRMRARRVTIRQAILAAMFATVMRLLDSPPKCTAQQAIADQTVELPGIGRTRLGELPPDLRENIRIPGVQYDGEEEQYGDLPPSQSLDEDVLPGDLVPHPPAESEQRPAADAAAVAEGRTDRRQMRQETLKRMRKERGLNDGTIPDDAYHKAWEHIQRMMPAPAIESAPSEVLDIDPQPGAYLGFLSQTLFTYLSPLSAIAQGGSPPWNLIGPAPFATDQNTAWAGFVGQIALHPSDLNTAYVATFGGIWKTTDDGQNWTNLSSDDQETQRTLTVILNPANPNILYAGTGWDFFFGSPLEPDGDAVFGRGILRSLDGGSTWCAIGPPWPEGEQNSSSRVAILDLLVDGGGRLWAASQRGLFYSPNSTTDNCASVSWIQAGGGLPSVIFTNVLEGRWNSPRTVYASTETAFYRSEDGGSNWSPINSGLPSSLYLRNHAAIAQTSPTPGQDVLYVPVHSSTHAQCGYTRDRVYRGLSSASSTSWTVLEVPGDPCQPAFNSEHGIRSVEIHPTAPNASVVVVGADNAHLSTNGGNTFTNISSGPEGVHPDQNDVVFGPPSSPNRLYLGNDGGIWRRNNYASGTWNNLNGDLANVLFYRGTIDTLNHGVSRGGTQDNGDMRGSNDPEWDQFWGGDGSTNLIDFADSNVTYYVDSKTKDGGLTRQDIRTCELATAGPVWWHTMVMDPANSETLAVYGGSSLKVYRTTNGGEPTGCGTTGWKSITSSPTTIPDVNTLLGASQTLFFAATEAGKVWRTRDAANWCQFSTGLPSRSITSLALASLTACAAPSSCTGTSSCTLFASVGGWGGGHVFRSTNGGVSWTNISGSGATALPDLPANRIAVHPNNPTVVWVATDLGLFQGCLTLDGVTCSSSGTSWIWGTYSNGLPSAATVTDLAVHKESGLLRAFTLGHSSWEVQAFAPAKPEFKVNTTNPVTDITFPPQIGSNNTGSLYSIAWIDDRVGANNWHVYIRGYGYDASGNPAPLGNDLRVDDTSTHVVTSAALAAHPTQTAAPYCSKVAWADDRYVNQHVFFQHVCSDGYKLYVYDVRADQHPTNINATMPSVAYQQNLDFPITWTAERTAGSSLHDVYTRFFNFFGYPKTNQFKVNASDLDATAPAVASDSSDNVFIAWQEFDSATSNGRIMASKYNSVGTRLIGPVQVDNNGQGATQRNQVALALDSSGNVMIVWWEWKSDGTQPEKVFRRRFSNALSPIESQAQVNNPPSFPSIAGKVDRAMRPSVARDPNNNFLVTWQANVNDNRSLTWNAFGRTFNSSGSTLKKDHRLDLAPRTAAVRHPRVARSSQGGKFVLAWRENRAAYHEIYTRVP